MSLTSLNFAVNSGLLCPLARILTSDVTMLERVRGHLANTTNETYFFCAARSADGLMVAVEFVEGQTIQQYFERTEPELRQRRTPAMNMLHSMCNGLAHAPELREQNSVEVVDIGFGFPISGGGWVRRQGSWLGDAISANAPSSSRISMIASSIYWVLGGNNDKASNCLAQMGNRVSGLRIASVVTNRITNVGIAPKETSEPRIRSEAQPDQDTLMIQAEEVSTSIASEPAEPVPAPLPTVPPMIPPSFWQAHKTAVVVVALLAVAAVSTVVARTGGHNPPATPTNPAVASLPAGEVESPEQATPVAIAKVSSAPAASKRLSPARAQAKPAVEDKKAQKRAEALRALGLDESSLKE